MNAADYINEGYENAMTRQDLVFLTGLSDRQVRMDIEEAFLHGDLVINLQDGKGYFKPLPNKEDDLVRKWINISRSRIKYETRKLRMAERYLEDYE